MAVHVLLHDLSQYVNQATLLLKTEQISTREFLVQTVWFQRSLFLYVAVLDRQAPSVFRVTLFNTCYLKIIFVSVTGVVEMSKDQL